MTRDDFIKRLERGLAGMPADVIAEITGDYTDHFDAAAEDGRSEAEVAEALGDPGRIARELRLEAGIKRWEQGRSPSAAWVRRKCPRSGSVAPSPRNEVSTQKT